MMKLLFLVKSASVFNWIINELRTKYDLNTCLRGSETLQNVENSDSFNSHEIILKDFQGKSWLIRIISCFDLQIYFLVFQIVWR